MKSNKSAPRPVWLLVLALIAGVSLIGFLIELLSSILLSNVYFIAACIFLLVAAVPIFGELGGTAKTGVQARREGKRAREVIAAQEQAGKYSRGARVTFIFGTSAFLCFFLAILTL